MPHHHFEFDEHHSPQQHVHHEHHEHLSYQEVLDALTDGYSQDHW